jgi:hypothetical protein
MARGWPPSALSHEELKTSAGGALRKLLVKSKVLIFPSLSSQALCSPSKTE